MKTFLIIVAVIVAVFALILSIRATFTIINDEKTITKVKVLFWEFDIDLVKILSAVLFPEQKAQQIKQKKEEEKNLKQNSEPEPQETEPTEQAPKQNEPANNNGFDLKKYIKGIYDKDGILGILDMVQTIYLSIEAAVKKFFKCFHIHSLYVKIDVGGADADSISREVGKICSVYYPVSGMILNGMKVDNYNHSILPDYLASQTKTEFQFIASISVGNLLGIALSAGKTFLVNLIKNK